ncbi:delta-60 repeat domain-containing protein/Por secretion system C-terminal sorting domain-containing protein, partial [Flavobacterium swingsii]
PDGKILVGGDFTTYNGGTENKIIRLNSDGTKGSTFITGTEFNNAVNSIAIQPDGKILVGGDFGVTNYIIRLNSDGTKDTTFNTGTGFNNYVKLIAVQPDGKILLGGDFTTYNGGTENYIIRLSSDGTKDSTFTTGIGFNAGVDDISIQPDGKILVGGNFTTYKGVTQNRIIRLNTDGTKDTTFTTGIGFNSVVDDIAIQSDGKILVGGLFTTYQGVTQNRIIRLNSDGTKDTTFNTGTGFNNPVYAIAIQPDGKILVGGNFTTYKGVTQNRIIRLNTDGTKDTTFNTGTGFNNYVFAIAIQPDGKILVGGYFTTYKGVTQNYIIRLNSDGSKDSTFNIGTGFNSIVDDIAIQSDGKILVGGSFTTYQGVTQNGIIRLNSDGTKDTTFNTGTGFNDFVSTITIQTDGKILVGGNFTTYQGNNQSAMLIGLHSGLILATENFSDSNRFGIYPNPVKDILTINSLDNDVITAVKIHDLQGKLIQETASTTIPLSNLSAGIYMVKVTTEKGEETKKFIKE